MFSVTSDAVFSLSLNTARLLKVVSFGKSNKNCILNGCAFGQSSRNNSKENHRNVLFQCDWRFIKCYWFKHVPATYKYLTDFMFLWSHPCNRITQHVHLIYMSKESWLVFVDWMKVSTFQCAYRFKGSEASASPRVCNHYPNWSFFSAALNNCRQAIWVTVNCESFHTKFIKQPHLPDSTNSSLIWSPPPENGKILEAFLFCLNV